MQEQDEEWFHDVDEDMLLFTNWIRDAEIEGYLWVCREQNNTDEWPSLFSWRTCVVPVKVQHNQFDEEIKNFSMLHTCSQGTFAT